MIDRKTFVDLFNKYNLDELFYDVVDGKKFTELDKFLIYYDVEFEQVNIVSRGFGLFIITWYKYMHPGRGLEMIGVVNKEHLNMILEQLAEDCEAIRNGNKL